ncbi:hypothetical protein [Polynucleobacter sp. AP-RePozz3-80-G7]|uniref:hypothetical protein n=1 Tax=Polynucleobacter sp. AP-RePozz3-80-G7 TaxID=2689105 RepID=UPI001C0E2978|nr:hypothetical protein [Polynucleobacter sp. AP-RePozz3-80-G7]MBU3638192.1 hypothetical protein [Polynucleobacter sp. AP-RePozz3-80-G7]
MNNKNILICLAILAFSNIACADITNNGVNCAQLGVIYSTAASMRDSGASPQQAYGTLASFEQSGMQPALIKKAINEVYFDARFTYARGMKFQQQMMDLCMYPNGHYKPLVENNKPALYKPTVLNAKQMETECRLRSAMMLSAINYRIRKNNNVSIANVNQSLNEAVGLIGIDKNAISEDGWKIYALKASTMYNQYPVSKLQELANENPKAAPLACMKERKLTDNTYSMLNEVPIIRWDKYPQFNLDNTASGNQADTSKPAPFSAKNEELNEIITNSNKIINGTPKPAKNNSVTDF